MASVDVVNVRKSYGNVEVIHDVSIAIADGEFVTLVGPSGCGKSTLLRMIAGLETIPAGKIRIGARVVNNLAPKDRDIAMVFQNYALYPHKTVAENMSFGLKLQAHAEGRDRRADSPGGGHPAYRALPLALSAPAFGRPAAAGRDGSRDCA